MADNLTISIGADTSKMRADLALLQAELKAVGKDLAAAAKAGDVTSVNALAASYETVRKQSVALSGALKVQTSSTVAADDSLKEFIHSGRGLERVITEFSSMGRGIASTAGLLGVLTGGFAGGLLGTAIARGMEGLLGQLDAVGKKLLEIQGIARQTGTTPLAVQGAQEIARAAGESADVATKSITRMSDLIEKARTTSTFGPGLGPQVMRGDQSIGQAAAVQVFRGGIEDTGQAAAKAGEQVAKLGSQMKDGITIFRGGAPVLTDFSKPLEMIGVHLNRFTGDAKGTLEAQRAIEQGFLRMQKSLDPQQLNALSKALFDQPAQTMLKVLPGMIADLTKKIEELEKAPRGAIAERLASQEDLDKAKSRLDNALADMAGSYTDWLRGVQTDTNNWLADFLTKTLPEWSTGTQKVFADLWTALGEQKGLPDVVAGWLAELPDFQPWIDKTLAAFQAMWDRIKSAAASVRDTLSSSFPGDPSIPAMPMAGGGMIRGPGSGTSDSILARLSNGEFVMRSSAVRAWGADFMAGLNAFSDGGLVRPIPRFAGGGMVTATTSDGVTVNLHFPGGTYALRGDAAIVGGLTREARRAGMLSAGRLAGALA